MRNGESNYLIWSQILEQKAGFIFQMKIPATGTDSGATFLHYLSNSNRY